MNSHPLHDEPLSTAEQLGMPIPASPHAVSMCLPRWEDVIGYEERDPATLHALKLGYPRFLIHPYVYQLANRLNPDPDRHALPFPTAASADHHRAYLLTQQPDLPIDIVETRSIHLVLFPAAAADLAKQGWQLLGEGLSSRHAEAILNQDPISDPHLPADQIRQQLATYTQTDARNIYLFPSGMAALHAALRSIQTLRPGLGFAQFGFPYGDTLKLLEKLNKTPTRFYPYGDHQDLNHLKADITAQPIAGLFTEFPSNPLLASVDLEQLRTLADTQPFPIVLDETLAACVNLNIHPFADISTISLTKYFSGEGDALGGALLLNPDRPHHAELQAILQQAEKATYCFADDLQQLHENAHDLPQRIESINRNALQIAAFLEEHPAIEQVWHPSLTDHEIYDRHARQADSYGGVLSFTLEFPEENTIPFYDKFNVCKGPNLGTIYTLCCPFVMLAHYHELNWAEDAGASRWLIRLSVGTEPVDELIDRLERALT